MSNLQKGDIVRNTKTDKIGYIIAVYEWHNQPKYVKWCLYDTPNNVHTCINPDERLEVIHKPKPTHWSYFTEDIFS